MLFTPQGTARLVSLNKPSENFHKYECTLELEPTQEVIEFLKPLKAKAIAHAGEDANIPFHKGDPSGGYENENYYYLKVASKFEPELWWANHTPAIDVEVTNGSIVRLAVKPNLYKSSKHGDGMNVYLGQVEIIKLAEKSEDGESKGPAVCAFGYAEPASGDSRPEVAAVKDAFSAPAQAPAEPAPEPIDDDDLPF